jgi:chromosome segregation ATPase
LKALTIRVEDDVFDKIESERGNIGRADYFRKLIESHFNEDDSIRIAEELNKTRIESENVRKKLELSESRISDLLNQIDSYKSGIKILEQQLAIQSESHKQGIKILEQQLGFLQMEYQKISDRLMLPAPKPRWQFWKKYRK